MVDVLVNFLFSLVFMCVRAVIFNAIHRMPMLIISLSFVLSSFIRIKKMYVLK